MHNNIYVYEDKEEGKYRILSAISMMVYHSDGSLLGVDLEKSMIAIFRMKPLITTVFLTIIERMEEKK